jgi:hypothetical protein
VNNVYKNNFLSSHIEISEMAKSQSKSAKKAPATKKAVVKKAPAKAKVTKVDSLLTPIKQKKPRKTYNEDFGDNIIDIIDEISPDLKPKVTKAKTVQFDTMNDHQMQEEELKPLAKITVNIRDCKPEEADVLVKEIYQRLKVFDNETDEFEHKVAITIAPY